VSARERLAHRLDVMARDAGDGTDLAAFGRLCTAMSTAMHDRWPGLSAPSAVRPW